MAGLIKSLSHGSQAASYVLGGLVIMTAGASLLLAVEPAEVASMTFDVLGVGFITLLTVLIFVAAFALVKMVNSLTRITDDFWLQAGVQAANGVATLALTFTLLGISLGIGGLAGQALTPETVQPVIRDLTASFSLAFMTTVVGLPISASLRAILLIAYEKRQIGGSTS